MTLSRRRILGACCALASPLVRAVDSPTGFPSKVVTLLVPYPAGGTSDQIARAFQVPLAKALGQSVIVENLSGASGTVAVQKFLNAPRDGHTVFVGSPNELILAPLAIASAKYASEDLQMVQKAGEMTMGLLVHKDVPVSSVDELVAYAAQRAKAGKPVTYGSVGNGSLFHLLGEKMSQMTGVELLHVPYKGGAPMTQDLIGGQIEVYLGSLGTTMSGMIGNGRLKMLATLAPERMAAFPAVPSINESKALKGFNYNLWVGFFAGKGTPQAAVATLQKALATALADPAAKAAAAASQVIVTPPHTLAQAEAAYASSVSKYREIARSINLRPV